MGADRLSPVAAVVAIADVVVVIVVVALSSTFVDHI